MTQAAITSLTRTLSEWAERPANQSLFADQEQLLLSAIDDPRRRPQMYVGAWMLGTWHLGHGFLQVMNGNGRGFDEARIGQSLRRCSLLLRERHQQPARNHRRDTLPFSQSHGSLTALLGLALQDPGAEPLYDLLRRQPDSAFDEQDHLGWFVRVLLTVRSGERPIVTPRLGPYHEIMAHWHGDQRLLGLRLADVLDLHMQQVKGPGSTFDDPPSQLYPLEVLAVKNVREWLQLPTPKVVHAMMFTNLVTMLPDRPWPSHDLVQRLERALQRR